MPPKPVKKRRPKSADGLSNNPKTRQAQQQIKAVQSLADLLQALQIQHWDLLLVGDGSATTWEHEAGFATMAIENGDPPVFRTFHGGFSCGTNIVAEMMAYVHPLMYYSSQWKIKLRDVHIVTDCEFLPKAAGQPSWQRKNAGLWMMLKMFKQYGFRLYWHWIPRDCLDMNKFCDRLANFARKGMQGLAEQTFPQIQFTTLAISQPEVLQEEAPSPE